MPLILILLMLLILLPLLDLLAERIRANRTDKSSNDCAQTTAHLVAHVAACYCPEQRGAEALLAGLTVGARLAWVAALVLGRILTLGWRVGATLLWRCVRRGAAVVISRARRAVLLLRRVAAMLLWRIATLWRAVVLLWWVAPVLLVLGWWIVAALLLGCWAVVASLLLLWRVAALRWIALVWWRATGAAVVVVR
jgi:hypothetical protein